MRVARAVSSCVARAPSNWNVRLTIPGAVVPSGGKRKHQPDNGTVVTSRLCCYCTGR